MKVYTNFALNKDYSTKCVQKRFLQKEWLSKAQNKDYFLGLCGPEINQYINIIRQFGFNKIYLFETKKEILENYFKQCNFFAYDNVFISNESILDFIKIPSLQKEKVFYDLDFEGTIKPIIKYLPTIRQLKDLSLTVSVRGMSYETTLEIFSLAGFTNKEYIFKKYKDTSPMLTIYKRK